MEVSNLTFFDNNGYNLNFEWNDTFNYWEGNIYFPKVSVGLYANTNIYVMEKFSGIASDGTDEYYFPQKDSSDNKLTFVWDYINEFVDEFFMFTFDDTYYGTNAMETSALTYTPNNGPEVETLIVNRFEEYSIELDDTMSQEVLPLHIAFSSPAKYDATTFCRTLIMRYGSETIAKITFYAETVEEDERLKILTHNLGYDIKPADTIIFDKSDVKECYPDYMLLNEKRKELLIEGHNIYPYIGSYRALINIIKFFGYENLNIIEYWRNVNKYSDNYGMLYATSKYSLTNHETIRVNGKKIKIPNRNYRKTNELALVYTINHPIDEYDDYEIPRVEEDMNFTMEEIMIKLFALRRKLNSDFIPCTSRIVDIIGEATYFGLQEVMNHPVDPKVVLHRPKKYQYGSIDAFPSTYIYISDSRKFMQYAMEQYENDYNEIYGDSDTIMEVNKNTPISNIYSYTIEDINDYTLPDEIYSYIPDSGESMSKTYYYENYYKSVFEDFTNLDFFEPNTHDEDNDIKPTAKVLLTNTSFKDVTFEDVPNKFKEFDDYVPINGNVEFQHLNRVYYGYNTIRWTITFSDDQEDDELSNIDVSKTFDTHSFTKVIEGDIDLYNKVFVELPYHGYYDVKLEFTDHIYFSNLDLDDGDSDPSVDIYSESEDISTVTYTFEKFLKVEPYNLDIRGFYYDARELPDDIKYDMYKVGIDLIYETDSDNTEEYVNFINEKITDMTNGALEEHYDDTYINSSMPHYTTDGKVINGGPYRSTNMNREWYLFDNVNYDITKLEPNVEYARYIKNGVDVKPYTWFLLGFNESKITSVKNIQWTLTNIGTGDTVSHNGRYFTLMLIKEGDYNITLSLEDTNGNKYSTNRNILVVDENANYKIYRRFKEDYEEYKYFINHISGNAYDDYLLLEEQ